MFTLLTVSLLIIVVCNLGALLLYLWMARGFAAIQCIHDALHQMRGEAEWTLEDVADSVGAESNQTRVEVAMRADGLAVQLKNESHKTRQRIAQVKTRLADEERDDQKTKSQQRREAARRDQKS